MDRPSNGSTVSTPNVTPMIDVMLVLLIIFMVVTPSLLSGVYAEPPAAENVKPRPPEEWDHTLAMDASGELFLDAKPIARDRLPAALTALYTRESRNRVLYIRAHDALPFGAVSEAIEVARTSGVTVAGLVVEQKRVP